MTACLTTFQAFLAAGLDTWDASFSEAWRTSDVVDCVLSYAITVLVKKVGAGYEAGAGETVC